MAKKTLMKIQVEDSQAMAAANDLPNYSLAGTGKTLSTLEAVRLKKYTRGMVLGPGVALSMWAQEIEEWLGAKVAVLRKGTDRIGDADIVIAPYDLAAGSQFFRLRDHFRKGADSFMILDEAHNVRGLTTKRNGATFGVNCDGAGGYSELHADVWSLTGNPVWTHNNDIYGQLAALFPEVFAKFNIHNYDDFCASFCSQKTKRINGVFRTVITGSRCEALLHRILYKEIGALNRQEAPDLPPLVETLYEVPTSMSGVKDSAKTLSKSLATMTDEQLTQRLENPLDKDMQMLWQSLALSMVDKVAAHIVDVSRSSPVLVGAWHKSVIDAYVSKLRKHGLKVEKVDGTVSSNRREQIKADFNKGNLDAIVGQIASMGVSWNLQEVCHWVVIAQDIPSASGFEQFYKRVLRTGQTRPVMLDLIAGDHPLLKAVKRMRVRKAGTISRVRTGG
jgi:hypothetical protein